MGDPLTTETLLIDRRFHGPPESGNGGYVCGLLAQFIDGAATVRLSVPPPLSTNLEVRRAKGSVALFDDDALIAEARPATVKIEPIEALSYEEADTASRRFRGFDSHWFPSCFVCGPDRDSGDGLGIFPGPVEGRDLVASPWIPDSSLASVKNVVAPEFLWAALDCPGAFSFVEPKEAVVLLGELQVALMGEVSVGERCVVVAWEIAHQGRKHHTATALFGEAGACRGIGLGTWFEVVRDAAKGAV